MYLRPERPSWTFPPAPSGSLDSTSKSNTVFVDVGIGLLMVKREREASDRGEKKWGRYRWHDLDDSLSELSLGEFSLNKFGSVSFWINVCWMRRSQLNVHSGKDIMVQPKESLVYRINAYSSVYINFARKTRIVVIYIFDTWKFTRGI